MIRFVIRRLLQGLLTLLLVTFVVHTALTLLPGDPVRALFGPARPSPDNLQALREMLHFDKPWYAQYLLYVGDLLTGDWGYTFPSVARYRVTAGPPVATVLSGTIPISLKLLGVTLLVQALVGLGIGTVTARSRSRMLSFATYAGALFLVAMPVIVTAYALQAFLGWELGWFPVAGVRRGWISYVMPAVALSSASTAYVVLITRSELADKLQSRFVQVARARAIPEARLVGLHALRPAMVSVVTFLAANFGQLLTALVIVEGVFGIPGVGGALFRAIQTRDPGLLIALTVFSTALVLAANFVADVLHMLLDPRVRLPAKQR